MPGRLRFVQQGVDARKRRLDGKTDHQLSGLRVVAEDAVGKVLRNQDEFARTQGELFVKHEAQISFQNVMQFAHGVPVKGFGKAFCAFGNESAPADCAAHQIAVHR